jgi:hypothetical protein
MDMNEIMKVTERHNFGKEIDNAIKNIKYLNNIDIASILISYANMYLNKEKNE